jgi:hypothetical protein
VGRKGYLDSASAQGAQDAWWQQGKELSAAGMQAIEIQNGYATFFQGQTPALGITQG